MGIIIKNRSEVLAKGQPSARYLANLFKEICSNDCYGLEGFSGESFSEVVDVGANVGVFAYAAFNYLKVPKVFCFEPVPFTFECLKANLAEWGVPADAFNYGFGEEEGTFKVFRNEWLSTAVVGTEPHRNELTPHEDAILRTADYLSKFNLSRGDYLLKIDAEGGESAFFNSFEGREIIARSKIALIEVHAFFRNKRELKKHIGKFFEYKIIKDGPKVFNILIDNRS